MAKKNIVKGDIGNALHSVAPDHITTTSDEIFDEGLQMYQDEINSSSLIYDISKSNAVDGNPTTYTDLLDALGNNGSNIPEEVRDKCGIVKFIQSCNNKYVYYNRTSKDWSISPGDWQKLIITVKSVPSNGADLNILDKKNNSLVEFSGGHIKTKNFDSRNIDENNLKQSFKENIVTRNTLAQQRGESITNPMSQKVVTDELDKIDDNIEQIEEKHTVESTPYGASDLDITDKRGFALAKFSGGHIRTKNFDSKDIKEDNINESFRKSLPKLDGLSTSDLDIIDPKGFILARYKNGMHLTKHPSPCLKPENNYDLAIRDLAYNLLLELSGGHIRTKNFDSRNIPDIFSLTNAFDYKWAGYMSYSDMIPITVKKDGTGDFTSIQEAINSITDASPIKQYDIQVYDDFAYYNTTDLWVMGNPTQHAVANPTSFVCCVLTKDYVHIRGIGEQKTVYVESPSDLAGNSFQNIHNLYARGKCIINNFNFVIKGGRYASHGDDSGSNTKGTNAFATQLIINCRFEHKGNYMYPNGSAWTAICASTDICLSSGCHKIFVNDLFVSPATPIYGHNASNHKYPSKLTMINCTDINNSNGVAYPYISDNGCGHKTEVELINCNFNKFGLSYNSILNTRSERGVIDKFTNGGFRVRGYGNKLMPYFDINPNCWYLRAKNDGSNIKVKGGTAYDDIWLDTYKNYKGESNAPGAVISSARINGSRQDTINYAFTLAYRLGNCASSPKTLVVEVDNVEYTITFNKNYMTSDGSDYTNQTVPYIGDNDIIADINAVEPTIFESGLKLPYDEKDSFDDCKEIGINKSNEALLPGDAVKRDIFDSNRWVKVSANEIVEGIVAERIDGSYNDEGKTKYNEGKILKIEKNIFAISFINAPTGSTGTMYKNGTNGWEITSSVSDAQLINIGDNKVKPIK